MAVTGTEIGSVSILKGNKVNLPTLADGVLAITEDEKKLYIGTATGNQGIVSSAPTTQTWIAPTLLNSWVNYGSGASPVGYYKDDLGIVHLRGFIKSGIITQGTALFVLPAGYRPAFDLDPATVSNNGSDIISRISITSAGGVTIQSGGNTFFSLDIAPFRAEQ